MKCLFWWCPAIRRALFLNRACHEVHMTIHSLLLALEGSSSYIIHRRFAPLAFMLVANNVPS